MPKVFTRLALVALPLLAGLGATSLVTGNDSLAPTRCEIQATSAGRMISIAAILHSDAALGGSYRLKVKSATSGGSSDISQGGAFSAAAGATTTLGQVMLGAQGTYDVVLDIDAPGANLNCTQRFATAT